MYYVHSIISNQPPGDDGIKRDNMNVSSTEKRIEFTLPLPKNTLQLKYRSYMSDIITNYIMTMIIPSLDIDYYIQDDILGLVIQPDEFGKMAFTEESSFYDIENLMYDETSSETTIGFKAFKLAPSRCFWYSPESPYHTLSDSHIAYHNKLYTHDTVRSSLMILSESY